ncbi:MAG: heavy metal translocating P-type ATPase metal-binding domain-containing protein, partial [Xanthomonadales bacterium]|nr:heavy metal translocating P-type ATPase metal-binding domain-containing protein [Xanthomonadales bacterium]
MDSPVQQRCFHCGEAVPVGARFPITVNDHEEPACCAGCQAVASLIIEGGLDRYYQFRESLAPRVPLDADRRLEAWRAVDRNPALWGVADENGRRELLLQVEGIHCAACAWLIRSSLSGLDGLDEVHVDVASGVVQLNWRPDPLRPSELAERLVEVGYM